MSIPTRLLRIALLVAAILLGVAAEARAQTAFVYLYQDWRYHDAGVDLGAAWTAPAFDDAGWSAGEASLGAGSGMYNVTTHVLPQKTVYFRASFVDLDPVSISKLELTAGYIHGFVAYLNGLEVARGSLPPGPVTFDTPAAPHVPTMLEVFDLSAGIPALVPGKNVFAVEVHDTEPQTGQKLWAAELLFETTAPHATRGPYLQMEGPSSITVRWRTATPGPGTVNYGLAPTALDQSATEPAPGIEHEVALAGLTPGTRYYYAIAAGAAVLAGGDDAHSFTTDPGPGAAGPARIWVLGDSGTADGKARQVRDAYAAFSTDRPTDLVLMLGDNGYPVGTDHDYQYGIFENAFEATLRTAPLWPAFGNHDWGDGNSDSVAQTGPYFQMLTLPKAGELGGAPSGTEAYYSFDHGDVHFLCVENILVLTPEQVAWVEQDLDATDRTWVVAYMHAPPHTKGSHDSDDGGGHAYVRALLDPIFEDHGVDLVLAGHSHDYERSFLIDGHYGLSPEFAADPAAFTVDGGDGREDGDGAYVKPAVRGPHQGTVYVVNGNSGGRGDGSAFPLDHPAMIELQDPHSGLTQRGLMAAGSLVLDVDGARLDARYLDFDGEVLDSFTIVKAGGGSGGGGGGGATSAAAGTSGDPGSVGEEEGCGCKAPGGARSDASGATALLILLAGLAAARRAGARRLPRRG